MIDIAKIAAEGVSSALGLAATYRAPGAGAGASGVPVSIVPSDADARVEIGRSNFVREAIRFRVYSVPVGVVLDLKKGGSITRADDGQQMAGETFALTGDGEAADRGRYSWFAPARRVQP